MTDKKNPKDIVLKRINGLHNVHEKPIRSRKKDWGGSMSNPEYLTYLCDLTHPMVGPFIIEAINNYADEVIKHGDEMIAKEKEQQKEGMVNLICNELWVECAKFLRKQNYYQYQEGGA
jgi:hypothetical protein